ncbi:MAG: transposase, partial [bacterium]
RLHKTAKEGILVVWGILGDGRKVLLGMKLGNRESYEDWLEFFRDLRSRGLRHPVLGTTDGAPGLIRAFEECFLRSLRQHCVVHKKRNILAKVPRGVVAEVRAYLDAVYYAPDLNSRKAMARGFVERYGSLYPSAVKCFQDDLDACLNHLLCPVRHRRSISSTNLLERTFLEERRRTRVLARFFDEKSCLKLVFGSLMRASQGWRRIPMSYEEQLELIELRNKLGQRPGAVEGSSHMTSPASRRMKKGNRWTGKRQEAATVER